MKEPSGRTETICPVITMTNDDEDLCVLVRITCNYLIDKPAGSVFSLDRKSVV